jgi:hypothetical protein
LAKPVNVWCPHCNIGQGCKIYGAHPQGCQDFSCQWLLGEDRENEKPNQVDIVTDFLEFPVIGWVALLFEVTEGALQEKFASTKTLIKTMEGWPVVHRPINGRNKLFLPMHIKVPAGYSISIDGQPTDIVRA